MVSPILERTELADRAALIAQALAHPVRLQILEVIGQDGAYFMHIENALDRPQANLSQHLMVLREAGLVQAEREGMTVFYQLTDRSLLNLLADLGELAERSEMVGEIPQNWRCRRGRLNRQECHCPRCQS
jgi:ArsR family transcriptional regulator